MYNKINNVLFDLDGTLVDSINDIYICVNTTLKNFKLETISMEDTCKYVGNGAKVLIHKAINNSYNKHNNNYLNNIEEEVYNYYMKFYEKHCIDSTKLYSGVLETLELLYKNNINMFIISNKPNKMTIKTADKLNIKKYFKAIIGDGFYPYKKPDINIWYCLKKDYGINEENTIMIGDGIADYEFAKNANIKIILVLYGITDKNLLLNLNNEYYLNNFEEVSDYIKTIFYA